jgi:hypothetical protein
MTRIYSKLGLSKTIVTSLLIIGTAYLAGCSENDKNPVKKIEEIQKSESVKGKPNLTFAEREPFVAGFWGFDEIKQGMKRSQVEAVLKKQDLRIDDTPPFGPFFKDGDQTYMMDFCNNELTFFSWSLQNNEQFLKSFDQRTNREGFETFSINASVTHDERRNSDSSVMDIDLYHPGGTKAYTITYHLFPENAQIDLRDSRYGFNCEPRQSASKNLIR